MKANVTFRELWNNTSLLGFFFREQSTNTLEELVRRSVKSGEETIFLLDAHTEDMDMDEIEELFYNESVEECARELNIDIE